MQSNVWQATWCILFGFWTFQSVQRITTRSLDCFIRFGAYEVCVNTSYLSVYSNLFLLMAQALISRVIHTRHEQLCERVGAEFYVFHSFGTT